MIDLRKPCAVTTIAPAGYRKIVETDDQGKQHFFLLPNDDEDPPVPPTAAHGSKGGAATPATHRSPPPTGPPAAPSPDGPDIRFRSKAEQRGFTMLPNAILMSRRLTPLQKIVYMLLRHYAREDGACWPGQDRLATEAPCSRQHVSQAIHALQQIGLISIERRGLGKTNRYWIEPASDELAEKLARSDVTDGDIQMSPALPADRNNPSPDCSDVTDGDN